MRFFFFFFNEKETPLQSTRQLLKKTTKKKAPNPLEKEQILIRRRSPPASGDLPQASEVPLIPFPVFFYFALLAMSIPGSEMFGALEIEETF